MKIINFCVFNKMVSDRKILWFLSKWGVNHLKWWRNSEVMGKKRIMNYSQKLWPGTANWLVYYSIWQGPFFRHKWAFKKNCASVSWNLAVTSWNVLSQGIQTHILFPSWSSFWVLKNKILWFSHRNTQLSLYVWSQKIVTKGALYFQFLGISNLGARGYQIYLCTGLPPIMPIKYRDKIFRSYHGSLC